MCLPVIFAHLEDALDDADKDEEPKTILTGNWSEQGQNGSQSDAETKELEIREGLLKYFTNIYFPLFPTLCPPNLFANNPPANCVRMYP